MQNFIGLERLLFTMPSNMGLSNLVKKHYNLPVNKGLQTTIAENSYLSYEEATYAILDALLPLAIYQFHFEHFSPTEHNLKSLCIPGIQRDMKSHCLDSDCDIGKSSRNFHELANSKVVFALDFTQGLTKPFTDLDLDFYEIKNSLSYTGTHLLILRLTH